MPKTVFGFPSTKITDVVYGLQRVIDLARSITNLQCADRAGGYFVLSDANTGTVLLSLLVGEVTPSDAQTYAAYACEKADRVRAHMISAGHIFSRQSRNPEEEKWGGAVVTGDYILSFSGFPESTDEAMMVLLGIILALWSSSPNLADPIFSENQVILFCFFPSESRPWCGRLFSYYLFDYRPG